MCRVCLTSHLTQGDMLFECRLALVDKHFSVNLVNIWLNLSAHTGLHAEQSGSLFGWLLSSLINMLHVQRISHSTLRKTWLAALWCSYVFVWSPYWRGYNLLGNQCCTSFHSSTCGCQNCFLLIPLDTSHQNNLTLGTAVPLVFHIAQAKCEVNQMKVPEIHKGQADRQKFSAFTVDLSLVSDLPNLTPVGSQSRGSVPEPEVL